ncbi:uncharacterized protein LOC119831803 [Zerene cesonia]|uniref:uncharacterized protein LOC119831803 n=1 Tax=Zerene cesonia TaxID=33412 RepID=UPI0018E5A549|nr:uncharacterized protein LOC119831803 [Zerene cesonia]
METDKEAIVVKKDTTEILREVLHKAAKERGYKDYKLDIKQSSSEGANISSVLFTATISESNKDDINIFAKVACLSESVRKGTPFQMFETEILFYSDLIKTYKQIEEKHNVPLEHRFVAPEVYGINPQYFEETIAMENLMSRGYQMFDRFQIIDWNYTKESMTHLARLHALSIAYSVEQPEEFEEKTKNLVIKKDVKSLKEAFNKMLQKVLESAKQEHKDRLKDFIDNVASPERMACMMKPLKRTFITHGDYRPSNLMHKLREDGTYDIIPIDFQTLSRSNPIVDILYFLFSGSDKEFRAKYLRKSFDHYYSELCASLTRLDLNPQEIYPKEDFEYELKEVLPLGLFIGLLLLMVVTVEMEDFPKLDENSELEDIYYSPSESYKTRMNDLLEDCIAMGVI